LLQVEATISELRLQVLANASKSEPVVALKPDVAVFAGSPAPAADSILAFDKFRLEKREAARVEYEASDLLVLVNLVELCIGTTRKSRWSESRSRTRLALANQILVPAMGLLHPVDVGGFVSSQNVATERYVQVWREAAAEGVESRAIHDPPHHVAGVCAS
jgi:hypothetical protein